MRKNILLSKEKETPCFGCDKRTAYCHATCEAYAYFRMKRKEDIEDRKIKGEIDRCEMTRRTKIKNNMIKRKLNSRGR